MINTRYLVDFCHFSNKEGVCFDVSDSGTRPRIKPRHIFYSTSEIWCGIELSIYGFRSRFFEFSQLSTNIQNYFPSVKAAIHAPA